MKVIRSLYQLEDHTPVTSFMRTVSDRGTGSSDDGQRNKNETSGSFSDKTLYIKDTAIGRSGLDEMTMVGDLGSGEKVPLPHIQKSFWCRSR